MGRLGAPLDRLEAILGHLGTVLDGLGVSWSALGPSWSRLGALLLKMCVLPCEFDDMCRFCRPVRKKKGIRLSAPATIPLCTPPKKGFAPYSTSLARTSLFPSPGPARKRKERSRRLARDGSWHVRSWPEKARTRKTFKSNIKINEICLLGVFLEPFWGPFGALLGCLGALLGCLGPSWSVLEAFGHLGALVGASWEPLGALLGLSWGRLGTLLGRLGLLWVRLGALLGRFGALWGASGAVLGRFVEPLGPSWAVLGPKSREP